jgi:hypothetical protein
MRSGGAAVRAIVPVDERLSSLLVRFGVVADIGRSIGVALDQTPKSGRVPEYVEFRFWRRNSLGNYAF